MTPLMCSFVMLVCSVPSRSCCLVLSVSLLPRPMRYVKISFCSSGVQHICALNAGWWFVYPSGSNRGLLCLEGVRSALVVSLPQSLTTCLMAVRNCLRASCNYVLVSSVGWTSWLCVVSFPPLATNNMQSSSQLVPGSCGGAGVAKMVFRKAHASA